MYSAESGSGLTPERNVKSSTGGSGGQRVRKTMTAPTFSSSSSSVRVPSSSAGLHQSLISQPTLNSDYIVSGQNITDYIPGEEDNAVGPSEMGDINGINDAMASLVLSQNYLSATDIQQVDPDTRIRLQALLEASGLAGKLTMGDGKVLADPDIVRRLATATCTALDSATAALHRPSQKFEMVNNEGQLAEQNLSNCTGLLSLAQACTSGNVDAVHSLVRLGYDIHAGTEDGESLLSIAASSGFYDICEILLAANANVDDKGAKADCTPLMEAASAGNVDIVNLLIEHRADVNAKSAAGNTALHYAACNGHEEVVQMLVKAGANVEEHNENGHTPLMEAASAGFVVVAKIFLASGAGINTHSNEFKESALTLACYKGHLEMVKFLLEAGADQEHKTDEMHTALMEASMDGHVDVARLLMDHGAQVNMPADSFESPLTLAACGGHVELANLLMERGANIEEANDEGYTPLMEAAREGHEEMVALLLAHGADINAQTEETQETALTLTCCGGFLEVADFLIKAGADIELGCSTPLMEAAQEGHIDLVKFLLRSGANVHAQTQTGDTALTYACENGHTDTAEVLLAHGAELDHEAEGGRTALMKASRVGHLCTVQFLISAGADLNKATTNNDHTVLSLACAGGHLAVVELLLKSGAKATHKLKDGSTMLIEAAKGGHAAVVNLLLDFAGHHSQNLSDELNQSQFSLDFQQMPRVPMQGLSNVVPPPPPHENSSLLVSLPPMSDTCTSFAPVDGRSAEGVVNVTSPTLIQPDQDFVSSFGSIMPLGDNFTWITPASDESDQFSAQQQHDHSSCCHYGANLELDTSPLAMDLTDSLAQSGCSVEQELHKNCSTASDVMTSSQLLLLMSSFPNTVSVAQLLSLTSMAQPLSESSAPNSVACKTVLSAAATQSRVTLASSKLSSPHRADCGDSVLSSTVSAGLRPMLLPHIDDGGGDGGEQHDVDACCHHPVSAFQTGRLQLLPAVEAGDDVEVSTIALLSELQPDHATIDQNELQELLMQQQQQQWQLHLGQMMQLDVLQQQQVANASSAAQQPLVIGTDTATLLWHQQPQQVQSSVGLTSEQLMQQQQMLIQQQQQMLKQAYAQQQLMELRYNNQPLSMKGGTCLDQQQNATQPNIQSPRQKHRPMVKAQRKLPYNVLSQAHQLQQQVQNPISLLSSVASSNGSLSSCMLASQQQGLSVLPPGDSDKNHQQASIVWQQQHDSSQSIVDVQQQATLNSQVLQHHYHQQSQSSLMSSVPGQAVGTTSSYCIASSDTNAAQYLKHQELTKQLHYQLAQAQHLQQLVLQQQPTNAQQLMQQTQLHQQLTQAQKRLARVQVSQGALMPLTHSAVTVSQTVVEGPTSHGPGIVLPQAFGTGAVMPVTFDGGGGAGSVSQIVPVTASSNANGKLLSADGMIQQFQLSSHQSLSAAGAAGIDTSQLLKTSVGFECAGDMMTPLSSSLPLSPNPSPVSPVMTPPVYQMSIEVDAQTEANHDTALTLACAGGHAELVSLLLARSANIEHRDKKGFTPLIHAATGGHVAVCEILLDNGADIEAQSERTKDTALSLACSGGRHEIVELLLRRSANREHRNVSDYTPLALAASGGYLSIIRLLLSHGAEINSRTGSKLGISPLMLAAMNGHAAAVSLLADMGSDINAQIETNRNTALTLACFQGRHEVVSILIDKRANIEHRAKTGLTPLMEAASGGYVEVGRVLLDKGADIAAAPVPSSRDTALTIAADKGHYRFVELLLSRGAAVDVKNKKGQTALWLACNGGHLDVVQLLVSANASTDLQDQRKVSCLMAAFRCGHVKVVRWLVRHVTQFPSDSECQRYIASVIDADQLKRCQQCMEVIITAKDRQAAEANKNAAFLLEEIESERNREESKRVKAAKKREKKRQKKREKQGRENDLLDAKNDGEDELDRNDEEEEEDSIVHSANDPVTEMMKVQQAVAQNERERVSASLFIDNGVDSSRNAGKKSRKPKKSQSQSKSSISEDSADTDILKANLLSLSATLSSSIVTTAAKTLSPGSATQPQRQSASSLNSSSKVTASGAPTKTGTCAQSGSDLASHLASLQLQKTGSGQSSVGDAGKINASVPALTSFTTSSADHIKQSSKSGTASTNAPVTIDFGKQPSQTVGSSTTQKDTNAKSKPSSKLSGKASSSQGNLIFPQSSGIGDLDDFGTLPVLKLTTTRDKLDIGTVTTFAKTSVAATRQVTRPSASSSVVVTSNKQVNSIVMTMPSTSNKKLKGNGTVGGTRKHDEDQTKKIARIMVPAKAISRIIGRAGCNINAIREATGAQVDLDKLKNSADAVVTIKGASDPVREAHDLVIALIRESDKDIDQLIPQMKKQMTVATTVAPPVSLIIPAPPPPSNVWKNNMARSIPASSIIAQSLTTSASSVPAAVKLAAAAPPTTTVIMESNHTTITSTAPALSNDGLKPQPIGAFPIGAWTPVSSQLAQSKRSPGQTSLQAAGNVRREQTSGTQSKPSLPGEPSSAVLLAKAPGTSAESIVAHVLPKVADISKTMEKPASILPDAGQIATLHSPPAGQGVTLVSAVSNISDQLSNNSQPSGGDSIPYISVFDQLAKMVTSRPCEIPFQLGSIISQSERFTAITGGSTASSFVETEALQAKAPGYRPQPRTASPRTADIVKRSATSDLPMTPIKMMSPSGETVGNGTNMGMSASGDSPRSFMPFGDTSVSISALLTPSKSVAERNDEMAQNAAAAAAAAAQYREEYISLKNPMTLPRIDSNLNPNAPDFTSKMGPGASDSQNGPSVQFLFHQHLQQMQQLQMAQQGMSFPMHYAPPHPPGPHPASAAPQRPQVYGLPPPMPPQIYSQPNGNDNASPPSHAYLSMANRPPPPSDISRISQLASSSISGAFGPSFVQRGGEMMQANGPEMAALRAVVDTSNQNQQSVTGHPVQSGMFVQDAGTGPASGDGAQHSFVADSKRSPPDQMVGHIPLPFDERRSMQPIGTERSSKKARTQQPTPDPIGFNDSVIQQQQQQQLQQQQHMWTLGQSANVEWLKTMPPQSAPLSSLSMSGPMPNDVDDRNNIQSHPLGQQQMFLSMASHGAGPVMGASQHMQHMGFQPGPPPPTAVGPPSMSLPRVMMPGMQHNNHLTGMGPPDSVLDQQAAAMMISSRPNVTPYINGLPSHITSLPPHLAGANMYAGPTSSAVRMDGSGQGIDSSVISSWSTGQPMKPPVTTTQQQSSADPRMPPMWNMWTLPQNF